MTKPLCSDLADIEWLTGPEAGAVLAELADDSAPLHAAAARLRRAFSAERTHLLLDQVELRRRAAAKFTQPERMFFTRVGLEQATDEWAANYKSQRFNRRPVESVSARSTTQLEPTFNNAANLKIADLCCGIGGDLMALAKLGGTVGVDLHPACAHFAKLNARAEVQSIDATKFDLRDVAAWHIDPDRRPAGKRTTSLEWCAPDRTAIEWMLARTPHAAVKLAPATNVPPDWEERCELEWISRDGECKQLVAWHGDLASAPGERRATLISSRRDTDAPVHPVRTMVGKRNQPVRIATAPDRYVFDIDAAVIAARLTGALAAEHHLKALSGGGTYLTGPTAIAEAALSAFEVLQVLPLRTRALAQHLKARHIGQLEIKKRGVDVEPEKLRRELKLRGDNAATLIITPIAGRPTAILAQRVVD